MPERRHLPDGRQKKGSKAFTFRDSAHSIRAFFGGTALAFCVVGADRLASAGAAEEQRKVSAQTTQYYGMRVVPV